MWTCYILEIIKHNLTLNDTGYVFVYYEDNPSMELVIFFKPNRFNRTQVKTSVFVSYRHDKAAEMN